MSRKKAKPSKWNKLISGSHAYLILKMALLVFLFYIFSKNKAFIFIIIFELLDFFKNVIKQTIQFVPLDFVFVFGIIVSYYYGFTYGAIIFFLGILNRVVMSCIEIRHLTKGIRHLPLFFIATQLKFLNFFTAAMILLIANYVFKFIFRIAKADLEIEKTPFNIINFTGATLLFYLVYVLFTYLPFLA